MFAAFAALGSYKRTTGEVANPPARAGTTGIELTARRTLVVAVHPKCACTKATLYELERIRAAAPAFELVFLVFAPPGNSADWDRTVKNLKLPGRVIADPGGRMAHQLGCQTSGSVVLYDASGTPLFWGGITATRGHAGANAGAEALLAHLRSQPESTSSHPVFGCSLQDTE